MLAVRLLGREFEGGGKKVDLGLCVSRSCRWLFSSLFLRRFSDLFLEAFLVDFGCQNGGRNR